MPDDSYKSNIFISYAHLDEPEKPANDEVQWLTFVMRFLRPALKHGVFSVWNDRQMSGGALWNEEIEKALLACDIFILLVSTNSMSSDFIVDKEIEVILQRRTKGDAVEVYPLLLTPTPKPGLAKIRDFNVRPRDAKPLSSFSRNDREQQMSDSADEIAAAAEAIVARKAPAPPPAARPGFVHISGLPETAYEKLVGRDAELQRLDEAWDDPKINILSLVAEGGAGKSALVNEWLKRMQADNYRGAAAVLGWSFYSQGAKERATSADAFLDWAMQKLGLALSTTSAVAKGEAIAEAMTQRRALLTLDGVEPLQHGPDGQIGLLKDPGLRALLRRFAATPPSEPHGLIVLTSRLAVADIARWKDGAAPIIDVEQLSEEAGAALLRDNGVWGTSAQLKAAARNFGGHPLALGLLASYLKETQNGDVRRRDRLRGLLADVENPGHDHARRVMESYEKEWLAGHADLAAIMQIVGLFDRPASGDCLAALRAKPVIAGLTEPIVDLGDGAWLRAVARLRAARLLTPADPSAPNALDAHPLVREWFGERLKGANEAAWKAAHGRVYEHLRDETKEGAAPKLSDLAPLYQAIAHGCRAERYQDALDEVFVNRICRRRADGEIEFYSWKKLGAFGSDLAAVSWFFDKAFEMPVQMLHTGDRAWALSQASWSLCAQGRIAEALPCLRAALKAGVENKQWHFAATVCSNLSEIELLVGAVAAAVADAQQSIEYADRSGDWFQMMGKRATLADALHAAGRSDEAKGWFVDCELRQREKQPQFPLYSLPGYRYCELLLSKGEPTVARELASKVLETATG